MIVVEKKRNNFNCFFFAIRGYFEISVLRISETDRSSSTIVVFV